MSINFFRESEADGGDYAKRGVFFEVHAAVGFFAFEESKCLFLLLFREDRTTGRDGSPCFIKINIRYGDERLSIGVFFEELGNCLMQYGVCSTGAKWVLLHKRL